MPIYEYRCRKCDATFETLVPTGTAVVCPPCGSSALDKLLSAPVVLSGQTARQIVLLSNLPQGVFAGMLEVVLTSPASVA